MDQSQFQAYEVAGATDMNRLHQFPQDYFQEVVEGLIGDNSDALFGTAGFSSSIVAGPLLQIIVNAQTFAAAGRIGSVSPTLSHHASSIPAKTQRFYIYLDIQTTEVSESRDIANPGTGVKTPTNIVTHKTAAASVVVIEVDQGDPEAPPAIGVIAPGVERLGYIKLGYVDYNEVGATNVDVFNIAGIFTAPGTPNVSLTSLDDIGDVNAPTPATGDLLQNNGASWVNVTVQDTIGDTLRHVNGLRLSTSIVTPISPDFGSTTTIYAVPYSSPYISLFDGTKYVLRSTAAIGLLLSGLTIDLPYDVFAYLSGGSPALELLAWTNATTRATAVSWTGGVLTKSGDQTRRYLGTIVPSAANTVSITAGRKAIWNFYNQIRTRAHLSFAGLTYSIPDTGGIFRQVNADTANKLEVMIGFAHHSVEIRTTGTFLSNNNGGVGSTYGVLGFGFESTIINNAFRSSLVQVPTGPILNNLASSVHSEYSGPLAEGFRTINWNEYCALAGGATMFFYSSAVPLVGAGIVAETMM